MTDLTQNTSAPPAASSDVAQPVPTVPNPLSAVPLADQAAAAAAVGVVQKMPEDPANPAAPPTATPTAAAPEAYSLKLDDTSLDLSDGEVALFKELNLSNDQAQKLVQYFADHIAPTFAQEHVDAEAGKLMTQWGMQDRAALGQRMDAVRTWADKSLPPALVKELGRTASGVTALYNMMQSGTAPAAAAVAAAPAATPEKLQSMLSDPRYWDGDSAYRKEVEDYAKRIPA